MEIHIIQLLSRKWRNLPLSLHFQNVEVSGRKEGHLRNGIWEALLILEHLEALSVLLWAQQQDGSSPLARVTQILNIKLLLLNYSQENQELSIRILPAPMLFVIEGRPRATSSEKPHFQNTWDYLWRKEAAKKWQMSHQFIAKYQRTKDKSFWRTHTRNTSLFQEEALILET